MREGWFWLLAVGTLAAMAGFWSGRFSTFAWVPEEGEADGESGAVGGTCQRDAVAEGRVAESGGAVGGAWPSSVAERGGRLGGSRAGSGAAERGGRLDGSRAESGVAERGGRLDGNRAGSGSLLAGGCAYRPEWLRHRNRRRRESDEKKIPVGWAVGSPGEGAVIPFHAGGRKGALVRTTGGCLYAPASGKIVKLYPSGSQMMLRTDFGVELLIRVGGTNEMMGEYFRPRVLQNEIVGKGKLLLEYDRAALLAAGEDVDIAISVEEAGGFRDVTVTGKTQVKIGEEILWVRERFGAYSEI